MGSKGQMKDVAMNKKQNTRLSVFSIFGNVHSIGEVHGKSRSQKSHFADVLLLCIGYILAVCLLKYRTFPIFWTSPKIM